MPGSGSLGGGGGGGGVALAPNGAFGDPTQVPSFMGWFADPNDLFNLNGGDPSIWVDGCWAITYAAAGAGEPVIWVLDNANTGWWWQVTPTPEQAAASAKSAATDPSFIEALFPGAVTFGQTRRILLPFAGSFNSFTADLRTAGANPTRLDVVVGSYNVGTGVFTPRGTIFNSDPSTRYLGAGRTVLSQGLLQPTGAENHFAYGEMIEVQVIDGGGGPSGGADLTVRLGVAKA